MPQEGNQKPKPTPPAVEQVVDLLKDDVKPRSPRAAAKPRAPRAAAKHRLDSPRKPLSPRRAAARKAARQPNSPWRKSPAKQNHCDNVGENFEESNQQLSRSPSNEDNDGLIIVSPAMEMLCDNILTFSTNIYKLFLD